MNNPFTKHPRETVNPQSYFKHGKFAFINSVILIFAGIAGMIHAIFPFLFKFTTSTVIIKSFKRLIDSDRHKKELNKQMPAGYINKKHL